MSLKQWILDTLFPPKCVFCGALAKDCFCEKCRAVLPFTGEHALTTGENGLQVASVLFYKDAVRDSILRYKFSDRFMYAEVYGRLLADCAAEHFSGGFDLVSYIPVSRKRRRERGYDQAALLAESMANDWDTEPVLTLEKVVDTPRQSSFRDVYQRRANVLGVYEAVDPARFRDCRILLVDDVYTTGSTMNEAASTLRLAGAKEVLGITLARTQTERKR